MDTFLRCLVLIFSFYIIGKIISVSNKPIIKKYIKIKEYDNYSNIVVNNFYGNIISLGGTIIVVFINVNPYYTSPFFITSIIVLIAFVIHVSDMKGLSIDETINFLLKNKKEKIVFMKTTQRLIFAIILTGIIGCYIYYPIINSFSKQPKTNNVISDINTQNNSEDTFYEDINDFFQ